MGVRRNGFTARLHQLNLWENDASKIAAPEPVSLDESTFERLLRQLDNPTRLAARQMIIDLEQVRFVDPYGMVGLLALARFLRQHNCAPVLMLPRSDEVMKYLDRMDFSRQAERLCAIDLTTLWPDGEYSRSTHSDVLLEITPIARSEDIHYIVERVRERAQTILSQNLHYEQAAIDGFVGGGFRGLSEHSRA